jgi:ATP-GRASP peptide maturase of grasp-with-spasm system
MEWIDYLGYSCERINDDDIFKYPFNLSFHSFSFPSNLYSKLDASNIIWYRRGLNGQSYSLLQIIIEKEAKDQIETLAKSELNRLIIAACTLVKAKWLSNPLDLKNISKPDVLRKAKLLGLDVPNTLVTNCKKELTKFLKENKKLILKPIHEVKDLFIDKEYYLQYTSLFDETTLNKLPDIFFPTLFQEALEKKIEIRSFFLKNKFYSMAIFSQSDPQTQVDFRHYNDEKPNRTIPYNLPKIVEKNLIKLMRLLKLDTGSIDIVVTEDSRFVFLEVNPIGQFGMVSYPCNYPIEKDIAKFLINQSPN